MNRHHIALTDEETSLVSAIDLRTNLPFGVDGHAIYLANSRPILALLKSLNTRDAIPNHRLAYWTDPALRSGRSKGSHQDIFSRNGSDGAEAYTHPHFIPFLRYFLFGADLPQPAIDEFEKQVGNPSWFSGSDIIALTKKTREIVRKYALTGDSIEFQKLALDNGLNASHANSVRSAAKTAARR